MTINEIFNLSSFTFIHFQNGKACSSRHSYFINMAGRLTILWILCVGLLRYTQQETVLRDYCLKDIFRAQCEDDSVIVMEEARYGRMALGTCLTLDVGFMGCFSDVLSEMDGWCSGRMDCSFPITTFLAITEPCPSDLGSYLQARFTCVAVVNPGISCCHSGSQGAVLNVDDGVGYLANTVTEVSSCGNSDCPWRIHSLPGQKINISIFDFGYRHHGGGDPGLDDDGECHVYAIIRDIAKELSRTVCAGGDRKRHLYITSSNLVEITIYTMVMDSEQPRYFILEYRAYGCAHPTAPIQGSVERNGDYATIRCYESDTTWEIICLDGRWSGNYGNCTTGSVLGNGKDDDKVHRWRHFSSEMAIILIIVVAVIVSLVFLAIGVICMVKRSTRRCSRGEQMVTRSNLQHDKYMSEKRQNRIFLRNEESDIDIRNAHKHLTTIPVSYAETDIDMQGSKGISSLTSTFKPIK